jgi:hypothetical protein
MGARMLAFLVLQAVASTTSDDTMTFVQTRVFTGAQDDQVANPEEANEAFETHEALEENKKRIGQKLGVWFLRLFSGKDGESPAYPTNNDEWENSGWIDGWSCKSSYRYYFKNQTFSSLEVAKRNCKYACAKQLECRFTTVSEKKTVIKQTWKKGIPYNGTVVDTYDCSMARKATCDTEPDMMMNGTDCHFYSKDKDAVFGGCSTAMCGLARPVFCAMTKTFLLTPPEFCTTDYPYHPRNS